MLTHAEVEELLVDPFGGGREWSLQGLGMLRTYLDEDRRWRLHIWDHRYQDLRSSRIHDHVWNFESQVIAGRLTNVTYVDEEDSAPFAGAADPAYRVRVHCGPGGCTISQPEARLLRTSSALTFAEGETYSQEWDLLHDTVAEVGTVTIVERTLPWEGKDPDLAWVYWFATQGRDWGSAEPRPATQEEVTVICNTALSRWF